jgi:sec-independent protein translocase protein TatA
MAMACLGLLGFIPGVSIGPAEAMVIGVIAVLLFGSKLPEVGRSLGKSLSEFRKGMRGIEEEFHRATRVTSTPTTPSVPRYHDVDDRDVPTAPKFDPPPSNAPRSEV